MYVELLSPPIYDKALENIFRPPGCKVPEFARDELIARGQLSIRKRGYGRKLEKATISLPARPFAVFSQIEGPLVINRGGQELFILSVGAPVFCGAPIYRHETENVPRSTSSAPPQRLAFDCIALRNDSVLPFLCRTYSQPR